AGVPRAQLVAPARQPPVVEFAVVAVKGGGMSHKPMRIGEETRPYVRVALRDTLEAYDLVDLLDLMADICQQNADNAGRGSLGLPPEAWKLRADNLREAAESLERQAGDRSPAAGDEDGFS